MSGTSAEHIQTFIDLEQACEAATFGRNQENVLDESYRKAGKMDVENFMSGLDLDESGLLDVVRAGLLTGDQEDKPVKAELYKLNVYGQSSFVSILSGGMMTSTGTALREGRVLQGPQRHAARHRHVRLPRRHLPDAP